MTTIDQSPLKLAYSVKEACEASSLSRTTLYSHIAAKRLEAVRIGGRTVIPADGVAKYAIVKTQTSKGSFEAAKASVAQSEPLS